MSEPLVLHPEAEIQLNVATRHEAILSLDGQVESQLISGEGVIVKVSPHVTRFLRIQPRNYFYNSLELRLRRRT
jgi:NAD kinase